MEREITLTQNQNKVTVVVNNAQSIEVLDANGKVTGIQSEQKLGTHFFYLQAGQYRVVADGQIEDITTEGLQTPPVLEFNQLVLVSDITNFGIDGTATIPADGQSFTTLTIQKLNSRGVVLNRNEDSDEIYLQTNAGIIKDTQGNQVIASVRLFQGQGSFRLYSENQKEIAIVQGISKNSLLLDATIRIGFQ